MSDIEKRARELLARLQKAKRNEAGHWCDARAAVDAACDTLPQIIAALTPPEGYVLVPVEPTTAMMEAAGRVVFQEAGQQWSDSAGFAEGFVVETQRLCHAAMLAARPEVP